MRRVRGGSAEERDDEAAVALRAPRPHDCDGALSPSELVDLYGSAGFDVLAITDHVCRSDGDFHRPEHFATWKTLLPCAKEEEAVVGYLRSAGEIGLIRLDPAVLAGREPARAA
ncbi:MAG: hypothetical protein ACJ76O_12700 [Gaiellaceae bacterium]